MLASAILGRSFFARSVVCFVDDGLDVKHLCSSCMCQIIFMQHKSNSQGEFVCIAQFTTLPLSTIIMGCIVSPGGGFSGAT